MPRCQILTLWGISQTDLLTRLWLVAKPEADDPLLWRLLEDDEDASRLIYVTHGDRVTEIMSHKNQPLSNDLLACLAAEPDCFQLGRLYEEWYIAADSRILLEGDPARWRASTSNPQRVADWAARLKEVQ